MKKYPDLRKAIEYFSVELGLDQFAAEQMLLRSIENREWGLKIRGQLAAAELDREISWKDLLCNDEYEVEEVSSEDEAKKIVMELMSPVLKI